MMMMLRMYCCYILVWINFFSSLQISLCCLVLACFHIIIDLWVRELWLQRKQIDYFCLFFFLLLFDVVYTSLTCALLTSCLKWRYVCIDNSCLTCTLIDTQILTMRQFIVFCSIFLKKYNFLQCCLVFFFSDNYWSISVQMQNIKNPNN